MAQRKRHAVAQQTNHESNEWSNMKDWQLRQERGAKAAAAVVGRYPPDAERLT